MLPDTLLLLFTLTTAHPYLVVCSSSLLLNRYILTELSVIVSQFACFPRKCKFMVDCAHTTLCEWHGSGHALLAELSPVSTWCDNDVARCRLTQQRCKCKVAAHAQVRALTVSIVATKDIE